MYTLTQADQAIALDVDITIDLDDPNCDFIHIITSSSGVAAVVATYTNNLEEALETADCKGLLNFWKCDDGAIDEYEQYTNLNGTDYDFSDYCRMDTLPRSAVSPMPVDHC